MDIRVQNSHFCAHSSLYERILWNLKYPDAY